MQRHCLADGQESLASADDFSSFVPRIHPAVPPGSAAEEEDATSGGSSGDHSPHRRDGGPAGGGGGASVDRRGHQDLRDSGTTAGGAPRRDSFGSAGTEAGSTSHRSDRDLRGSTTTAASAGTGSRTSVTRPVDNTSGGFPPSPRPDMHHLSDDADSGTLAELTSYATGVDLHPHHQHPHRARRTERGDHGRERRGDGGSSRERHRRGEGSSRERRRRRHREGEERHRRTHARSHSRHDHRDRDREEQEQDGLLDEERALYHRASRRASRHDRDRRRSSRRHRDGPLARLWALRGHPAVAAAGAKVADFFAGVNFRTVAVCVLMTMREF